MYKRLYVQDSYEIIEISLDYRMITKFYKQNKNIFRIFFHPPSVGALDFLTVKLSLKLLNNDVGSPLVNISAY